MRFLLGIAIGAGGALGAASWADIAISTRAIRQVEEAIMVAKDWKAEAEACRARSATVTVFVN